MSHSEETKLYKLSTAQTNILCAFFEENPEVIRGYKKTAKSIDEVQNKWKMVTTQLNVVGPPRDPKSWAKYLCNMKARLKKKTLKWIQSSNGNGPLMCNTDDFDQIRLRMLQVLCRDLCNSIESQETSDLDTEDDTSCFDGLTENDDLDTMSEEVSDEKPSLKSLGYMSQIETNTPPPNLNPPPDLNQHQIMFRDEFDYFGKNVAQQLRTMPICVALESQEMILSVLKKQRQKVLHEISRLDPMGNY